MCVIVEDGKRFFSVRSHVLASLSISLKVSGLIQQYQLVLFPIVKLSFFWSLCCGLKAKIAYTLQMTI